MNTLRLLTLVLCLISGTVTAFARLVPVGLVTEYLPNPTGIDTTEPRLSWRVESSERGQKQTAFRIIVASTRKQLDAEAGDLWDSGRVASDETVNIPYAGKTLQSGQACFWKVKVWNGNESRWSEGASWSMGLLKPEDWSAQWISFRDTAPLHADRKALYLPPARHYRKTFTADKKIVRATLYGSALGIAEFHLNGRPVSDGLFEPGWSDYAKRAYYRTHDVTKLLQRGENCVGAIVTDGWYAGYVGYGLLVGYGPHKTGRNFYGKTPALLAQLEIEFADGSRQRVATDPSWQVTADGPIREADLIMGESFDASRDTPNWCRAGKATPSWNWANAIKAEENGSTVAPFFDTTGKRDIELGFVRPPVMQSYAAPPIRVTQELKALRVTEPKPGVYIFDLGQNFAGTVRLKIKAPAGVRIQLRYGEMLHPDGRLMTENLRRARATDFYTCRGEDDTWSPRFTYHGFQFVEVTGLKSRPGLETMTGLVVHNDTPLTGEFSCSDDVMTKFWKNTQWTQRANFVELPTDCPQRDERLGWMGDAQIYARTASYNADVSAFFTKWIDDVREAQRDFGAYPDYCPYPMAHGKANATHGTAWTDAGLIVPHTVWQVYGDTRVLQRHWDSMTRFMDWRRKADPELKGINIGNTWGDWLNVKENTPIEFIDLCYHAHDAALMAEMAGAVGDTQAETKYRDLRAQLAASFKSQYLVDQGGQFVPKIETQTAHVLPLYFGLLPDAASARATGARLAQKIADKGYRMATGFLGTKALLPALTAHGHNDIAVRLFQSREFPSWGYEVVNGANSVWERWDSFTKEHGFNGADGNQNASMNSFSHYSFGAAMEWAYRDLAGIDTDGPGFKRILLRPNPPVTTNGSTNTLEWVKAHYQSIRGDIAASWKRERGGLSCEVSIPANTSATLFLPAASAAHVREGGKLLKTSSDVKVVRSEAGRVVLELGSGRYRFHVEP